MIAVIDYGLGNLRSVSKALEKAGARVEVTADPSLIEKADALVLPGVGAFARGMENLSSCGLTGTVQQAAREGKPLLGICLGLQLLFSSSEEYGTTPGLDILKGKVVQFRIRKKIPHMGWNTVSPSAKGKSLFRGIAENTFFYFVHSYYVAPEDSKDCAATADYGLTFCCAVERGNIWGVQFHPEKSGLAGLKVLKNFVARSKEC